MVLHDSDHRFDPALMDENEVLNPYRSKARHFLADNASFVLLSASFGLIATRVQTIGATKDERQRPTVVEKSQVLCAHPL